MTNEIKIGTKVWGTKRSYLGIVEELNTSLGITFAKVSWGKEIGLYNFDIVNIERLEVYTG